MTQSGLDLSEEPLLRPTRTHPNKILCSLVALNPQCEETLQKGLIKSILTEVFFIFLLSKNETWYHSIGLRGILRLTGEAHAA